MRRPEFIARQSACPSGFFGHVLARVMAVETAPENDITLDLLELVPKDAVLEIGFGHGHTIARAAERANQGLVAGVDVSAVMLRMAARYNRRLLRGGQADLRLADAASLPYHDAHFDKVYSVHTIYFWPDPLRSLREIRRVLRVGGHFVLGFRYDEEALQNFPAPIYALRRPDEVRRLLWESGFECLRIEERQTGARTLYWAIAVRPQEICQD